jgi:hypothetical protein
VPGRAAGGFGWRRTGAVFRRRPGLELAAKTGDVQEEDECECEKSEKSEKSEKLETLETLEILEREDSLLPRHHRRSGPSCGLDWQHRL